MLEEVRELLNDVLPFSVQSDAVRPKPNSYSAQVVSILQQHNRRYLQERKGSTFMSGRVGPIDTSRTKKVNLGIVQLIEPGELNAG